MTVTLSVALLLGVVMAVLCRYAGLKTWHALLCIVFGFCLASSSLAPYITRLTTSLFRLL